MLLREVLISTRSDFWNWFWKNFRLTFWKLQKFGKIYLQVIDVQFEYLFYSVAVLMTLEGAFLCASMNVKNASFQGNTAPVASKSAVNEHDKV